MTIRDSSSSEYNSSRAWMPKRERNGIVKSPCRVVAPINVKRGRGNRIEWAFGPWSIMMSSTKSSIAEYRYSSTDRCMRWISSMNKMSPAESEFNMPAKSIGFSKIGPDVA